jgi:large subunit ribosomal protein L11
MGIPMNSVLQKVNEATQTFKGMKVPIEIDINPSTKAISVKVFSPPAAELLKKEFNLDRGSGQQGRFYCANASIEQIISVAKTKLPNMLGIMIEDKPAKQVAQEIEEGVYAKQIKSGLSETPKEKRKKLDEYFAGVKVQQEKILKQEQAAKEAEAEAKKAATAGAVPAAGATGTVAAATPAAATPATKTPAKAPAKK